MTKNERDCAIKIFEEWLNELDNPDKPIISVGNKVFSARDIMREVKIGTTLGNKFLILKLSTA